MQAHYRDHAGAPFREPDGIVHRVICEESGALSVSTCTRVRREIFIEGTEPRQYCERGMTSIDDLPGYEGYNAYDRWGN
jgi:membrane carboxypeptidase/penicillin-binding protein